MITENLKRAIFNQNKIKQHFGNVILSKWDEQPESFFTRVADLLNNEIMSILLTLPEKDAHILENLFPVNYLNTHCQTGCNKLLYTIKSGKPEHSYCWIKGRTLQRQWRGELSKMRNYTLNGLLLFIGLPYPQWNSFDSKSS